VSINDNGENIVVVGRDSKFVVIELERNETNPTQIKFKRLQESTGGGNY
jgi:hypothetical protein